MRPRLVTAQTLAFVRNYATTRLRVDKRRPERPPHRPPDPLANINNNNPNAVVSKLKDDETLTFIHWRPPTAPSPFSLTTAPVSPLLRPSPLLSTPPSTIAADPAAAATTMPRTRRPLPPLLRPSAEAAQNQHQERERLSDEAVAEIRRLRRTHPEEYSRGRLAKMFGCTQAFVAAVAALPKPMRKRMVRKRDEGHARARAQWGERREEIRATRQRRRAEW